MSMFEFERQPIEELVAVNPTPPDAMEPKPADTTTGADPADDRPAAPGECSSSAAEPTTKKRARGRKGGMGMKPAPAVKRPQLSESRMIALEKLKVNPDRLAPAGTKAEKQEEENLEELARNMDAMGCELPLIVAPEEGTGEFLILEGNRRRAAADVANRMAAGESPSRVAFAELPCRVIEGTVPKGMRHMIGFVANLLRKDLSQVEKALKFSAILEETGWTQNELAEFLGLAKGTLSEILDILNLPKERREQVERREVSAKKAVREWKRQQKETGKGGNGSAAELRGLRNGHGQNGAVGHVYEDFCHRDEATGFVFTVIASPETQPSVEVVIGAVERWLGELRRRSCQGGG
jgi:ParB-like chromosome segregation protein Spo0J